MKFGKFLMVLGIFGISFVAVSVESDTPSSTTKPVVQLTEQEQQEKELELQRILGIPCDPYPKCAG